MAESSVRLWFECLTYDVSKIRKEYVRIRKAEYLKSNSETLAVEKTSVKPYRTREAWSCEVSVV